MKNKSDLIEYLTDILTGDPQKFVEFMGYDDIGRDLVEDALGRMGEEELNNTVEWYSDDYNDIEEFDEESDATTD